MSVAVWRVEALEKNIPMHAQWLSSKKLKDTVRTSVCLYAQPDANTYALIWSTDGHKTITTQTADDEILVLFFQPNYFPIQHTLWLSERGIDQGIECIFIVDVVVVVVGYK